MSTSNYKPSQKGYGPPAGYERMDKMPDECRTLLFITDHQVPTTIVGQLRQSSVLLMGHEGTYGWYDCGRVYAGWKYLVNDLTINRTEQPSERDRLTSNMLELLKETQAYFGVGEITKIETVEVSIQFLDKLARTIAEIEGN